MSRRCNDAAAPPEHRTTRRGRTAARWFVITLTCWVALASCVDDSAVTTDSGATIEQLDEPTDPDATTATPIPTSAPAPTSTPEPTTAPAPTSTPEPASTPSPTSTPEPTSTPTPVPTPEEPLFELQGELPLSTDDVNALIRFIQRETARDFLRPPVIVAQPADLFIDGLRDDYVTFRREATRDVRGLQSLGLTELGVEAIGDAYVDLLSSSEGIQGYYDPGTDELYVPLLGRPDDEVRGLLVHELTHALDGQHQDTAVVAAIYATAENTGDFQPVLGFRAIAEGRATWVENQWRDTFNIAPMPIEFVETPGVPPAILIKLAIPYLFGEAYIEASGGAAATWDLLENPPTTSEAFMLAGIDPSRMSTVFVAEPASDGLVIGRGTFGVAEMYLWLLGDSFDADQADVAVAFRAIDGWAGGASVTWGEGDQTCTRFALAADTIEDLIEIHEAAQAWASEGSDRSVELSGDRLTVTGCAAFIP